MSSWKGNPNNPIPNNVQESINRSEKIISDNRSEEVRRDKDTQKNVSISLYDIDETIFNHLTQLQLQVEDAGKKIKVPIFYGSPERWVSAQRDGYIRDNQGKLILPAIILKRTSSEQDQSLQFFNRYLNTSVRKLYSEKNKYTQFSILNGRNAPVNEIYNVVFPKHMILNYHFIIWTEKIEQMNELVSIIQYNTKDYWGTTNGLKFRTKIESYSHAVELQSDNDRLVKTEFDLTTHGYILPEQITKLENQSLTTNKSFTNKKFIVKTETVASDYDFQNNKNRDKWKNQSYPNLQADTPLPVPPVDLVTTTKSEISNQILNTLKSVTKSEIVDPIYTGIDNTRPFLRVVPTPKTQIPGGQEGYVSYDDEYFYIYTSGGWKRVAISQFAQSPPYQEGTISFNNEYFYLYSSGSWKQVAINEFS